MTRIAAAFVVFLPLSVPAGANPSPPSTPMPRPERALMPRFAQATCTCHNPVGAPGATVCRNQRVQRCIATVQNTCSWQPTTDRC